jgi:hypothetical protein
MVCAIAVARSGCGISGGSVQRCFPFGICFKELSWQLDREAERKWTYAFRIEFLSAVPRKLPCSKRRAEPQTNSLRLGYPPRFVLTCD